MKLQSYKKSRLWLENRNLNLSDSIGKKLEAKKSCPKGLENKHNHCWLAKVEKSQLYIAYRQIGKTDIISQVNSGYSFCFIC